MKKNQKKVVKSKRKKLTVAIETRDGWRVTFEGSQRALGSLIASVALGAAIVNIKTSNPLR